MKTQWIAGGALLLAACSAKAPVTDQFDDLAGQDVKSDSFSKRMRVLGTLHYGETSSPARHSGSPRYRAYKFNGHAGDAVSAWVRSDDGDAVAWLVSGGFKTLAQNDDADASTLDSHLTLALPTDGVYYVIYREYSQAAATFTVELNGTAAGGNFGACKVDADCVAVPRAACCSNGYKEAVAKGQERAYAASFTCPDAHPVCPLFIINDTRQPECNAGACQMVDLAMVACHGEVENAHHCAPGYFCAQGADSSKPGQCKTQCNANYTCPQGQSWDDAKCMCTGTCIDKYACLQLHHWDGIACGCLHD